MAASSESFTKSRVCFTAFKKEAALLVYMSFLTYAVWINQFLRKQAELSSRNRKHNERNLSQALVLDTV